jgi:hypothetical protein
MKKIVIIFSLIFAFCTLNAEQAIKGYDASMQYKSGTNVEFTFDGVKINLGTQTDNDFSAKMLTDDRAGNIFGHLWQIEGPKGAKAKMTMTFDRSLLLRKEMPMEFSISRVHDGFRTIVPKENIIVSETADQITVTITNIDQFSIWGLFDSNPPVPTLTEWAVIIFIGLLAGVGGLLIWRRVL